MYVVCNRFLRYEPTLERLVGPVREVAGDRRFKVLLAQRRRSPDASTERRSHPAPRNTGIRRR